MTAHPFHQIDVASMPQNGLEGVRVAVIGYGSQGRPQARLIADAGVDVVVGVRCDGPSWQKAMADGLTVLPIAQAVAWADVVHILLPDEVIPDVYEKEIKPHLERGNTISFAHGYAVTYGGVTAPEGCNCIMMAPKGIGAQVWRQCRAGGGVPALIAVHADATGMAQQLAFGLAQCIGSHRVGVYQTSMRTETNADLFSEQAVLCGGVVALVEGAFDTLTDAGYPPEIAYFECLHELKLIADILVERGIAGMWPAVSNTAEFGGQTRGARLITDGTRAEMRQILTEIESGHFAHEWSVECAQGQKSLHKQRKAAASAQIEQVGQRVRAQIVDKMS